VRPRPSLAILVALGVLLAAAGCGGTGAKRAQRAATTTTKKKAPPSLPRGCSVLVRPGYGLSRALDGAAPGTTVCLAAGSYDAERLVIRRSGRAGGRITLRSADRRHPATIRGTIWLARGANYWTFEDVGIDGRNPWNLPSPIINAAHSIWRRVDVTNHHAGEGTSGGGICFSLGQVSKYGYAVDTTIEDSRIHDCGISDNHNHGIYVVATAGWTIIRDNWIYRNGDRGIQLYPNAQHVLITHNLIDDNGSGIIFSGRAAMSSSDNVVVRNIISNSRNRWNVESWYPPGTPAGVGNVVADNCLWASNSNRDYDAHGGIEPAVGFTVAGGNVTRRPASCRGFGPTAAPPE
jgi:hypothetical protein